MRTITNTLGVMALLLIAAVAKGAPVPAIITKAGGGDPIKGMAEWLPASRAYVITTADGVTIKLTPSEVSRIQVKEPEPLAGAIKAVQKGLYQQAAPILQKIMSDYAMMEWDAVAGQWLAECHLKLKEPAKAATVCEKVIEANPAASLSADLAPKYWDALLETEQYGKLKPALAEAAQKGSRELAAMAQIKRGDMNRKQGNVKDALVDGYLRTAYFFQQVKAVQPEALYKAAQCFDELGQRPYAENMRKRLLADFPQDPYAEKVRAGT